MITVKITENDSDRYEYITFPVNKYSFYDQLDRAGIFGEYTAKISEFENETGLKNISLSDEPTVDELNFLAKRFEEICADKSTALAYNAVISQYETVSIAEAINRTYGLESVSVFPCGNAEEYGAVVLENDFLDDYEFDPSVTDFRDYGEKYLSEMLPPEFDRSVLSDGVTADFGRNISENNGSYLTEYGMLSSAGGQIYSMIEAEQTQQQGQMMSL